MNMIQNFTNAFTGQNKQAQTNAFQNFGNKFKTNEPNMTMLPSQNATFPTTGAGVKNPQQQPQAPKSNAGSVVDFLSGQGKASDFNTRAGLAAQYGITGYTGSATQNTMLLRALQGQTTPGYNPSSVNVKVDPEIPADALNAETSPTQLQEKIKEQQKKVLDSRFGKEEEALLKQIADMKMGVANLAGTQARDYMNLEANPEGVFGGVLGTQLNRLSKEQSLELSARTGQLNAMLDTLELYQGYRPQMVGTPQIDETTGEAFAYIQDPMTGEITTQSMGVITTPNPYANAFTLSEGQSLIDPSTGEVIRSIPKTYAPTSGGLSAGMGGLGGTASEAIDWEDPDVIDNLPVSQITKAVMSGTGSIKDLTPTLKAEVLAEMYSVGYNPNQVVANKLSNLVNLWEQMPKDQKGLIQGAKFWASKTVPEVGEFESAKTLLTRQIARLYDVGVLSDMDVKNYKDAMPSRYDNSLEVVKSKVKGIVGASTGKTPVDAYQEGTEAELDNGQIVVYQKGSWRDKFTGQPVNVE